MLNYGEAAPGDRKSDTCLTIISVWAVKRSTWGWAGAGGEGPCCWRGPGPAGHGLGLHAGRMPLAGRRGGRGCAFTRGPCGSRPAADWLCPLQAAELAEYTAKIALLEEARRRKEDEVEQWQHRVSGGGAPWGLRLAGPADAERA